MSDKAPSGSSSPNSYISDTLDTERDNCRSRRIGDPAVAANEAETAEEARSSSSSDASAAARVTGEVEGSRPAVAVAAVQSQLNHYARGLIMVQK